MEKGLERVWTRSLKGKIVGLDFIVADADADADEDAGTNTRWAYRERVCTADNI